ncbi:MAG: acyl-CoA thioesterase [Nitrospinae bacterium]|nr:acyl-CoA thioesterase [Nitrospinota bacterium]
MPDTPTPKPVRASRTVMSQLMMPHDANFAGVVHGGSLLSIMDKVAYACASRHAGAYCVTASVDEVHFRTPIAVGALVTFMASVNYVGRTSMEIGIRVVAEEMPTGRTTHTNSSYFTMVAMGVGGKPSPVPPLVLETDDDRRRNEDARLRRQLRLDHRRAVEAKQKERGEIA